jgi:hypothetical protein
VNVSTTHKWSAKARTIGNGYTNRYLSKKNNGVRCVVTIQNWIHTIGTKKCTLL